MNNSESSNTNVEGLYEEIKDVRETSLDIPSDHPAAEILPYEEVKNSNQTLPCVTPRCPMVDNPSYAATHIHMTTNSCYSKVAAKNSLLLQDQVPPVKVVQCKNLPKQEPLYAMIDEKQQLHQCTTKRESTLYNKIEEKQPSDHCLANTSNFNTATQGYKGVLPSQTIHNGERKSIVVEEG